MTPLTMFATKSMIIAKSTSMTITSMSARSGVGALSEPERARIQDLALSAT
jgi:hypothetical protein